MFSVSDSVNHLLWSSWKDTVTCLGEVDSSAEKESSNKCKSWISTYKHEKELAIKRLKC